MWRPTGPVSSRPTVAASPVLGIRTCCSPATPSSCRPYEPAAVRQTGPVTRQIGVIATSAFFAGAGAFGVSLAVPSAGASPQLPAQISITTAPHRTTLVTTPRTTAGSVPVSSTTKTTGTTQPGSSTTKPGSATTTLAGSSTSRFVPTTSTLPPTTTTIQGIGGHVPVVAATLPLHTAGTNGHVNPVFAWLSGIGFAIAALIGGARLFVTRGGGKDRSPLA